MTSLSITPAQAIEYAEALGPDDFGRHPDYYELPALRALAALATPKQRAAVLKEQLRLATAFQRSDQPGHAVWYPEHLRLAAWMAAAWAPKAAAGPEAVRP